jgi:2-hydroxychromene-2-carboxylate isomerase
MKTTRENSKMARIDYYFSVLSPFTYLAGLGLEEVAARRGATIAYRPMDIMKLFAETGGVPMPQRHPSRIAYRSQELLRIAGRRGLPFNLKPAHWPTNPVPASLGVIAVADAGGDAGTLAHAFLRAVWAEERDIGDPAVVTAILGENGHDAAALAPSMAAAVLGPGPARLPRRLSRRGLTRISRQNSHWLK